MSLRRDVLLGLAFLTLVHVADTKAEPMPTLAYVAAKNANPKRLDIFKNVLTELGYLKNIRIEYREAVLDADYDGVIAELIRRKVDIILAANVAATRAAARATKMIPIIMMAVFDPVGIGVVQSLERPGTNITGTTSYAPQLIGERLRILKRLAPQLDKIAMALNGQNPNNVAHWTSCVRKRRSLASLSSSWTSEA
jgi:putative tryptophan/tyrosine transport system substrate-binding protein